MDQELSAEHRTTYDRNYGGCALSALYNFPNGRRASVLRPHHLETWQFWDFDLQHTPEHGLTLDEINQRLREAEALES